MIDEKPIFKIRQCGQISFVFHWDLRIDYMLNPYDIIRICKFDTKMEFYYYLRDNFNANSIGFFYTGDHFMGLHNTIGFFNTQEDCQNCVDWIYSNFLMQKLKK